MTTKPDYTPEQRTEACVLAEEVYTQSGIDAAIDWGKHKEAAEAKSTYICFIADALLRVIVERDRRPLV